MKNKSIRSIFLGLFLITSALLKAQMAVLASGGNATGSNGSSSYSVGQVAYLYKGTGNQVMEGVQVAYEITTLATGEVSSSKETGILLYPNPFKDYVYLDFTTNDYKGSDYQLFDAQGKLIKKDKITQTKSEFNFSSLPSAMYIIRINQNGKNITTFKIIKK
ncbi:Por secretion system C-terminal sorting domain-containing protein [Chryseobacterium soldanellicola]|uniref:Por secretion system C-terminal sorting domain-containing protein n=1 Tax=Chryseobacterium soldanellicola TaxID=311333 RepID=A0A1H1ALN7_9FLAO|nr:T9SS type A sorting domain-containing protein [Chryseobacterium soldanellicola]SDQ40588.1 Por secretion system C-terminal sorting domain-containing protein [Chryseobacterium soldanellicola]